MTKRRVVTSTYRREFSPVRSASRSSVIKNCGANHHYREARRQLEHGHHKSPFVWEDWEYELEHRDQYTVYDGASKTRQCSGAVRASRSDSVRSSECSSVPEPPTQNQEAQTTTRNPKKQIRSRSRSSSLSSIECDCDCGASRERTAKDPQSGKITPRALSDTISKKLKNVSKRKPGNTWPVTAPPDDSPFAQYGLGDDELETGNKRTYNILSRQGVYPSAVKAHQRHQSAKELLKSRHLEEPRPHKTTMFNPRFDHRMNKQTSKWISEYQKNYKHHPADDYASHVHHKPPY